MLRAAAEVDMLLGGMGKLFLWTPLVSVRKYFYNKGNHKQKGHLEKKSNKANTVNQVTFANGI